MSCTALIPNMTAQAQAHYLTEHMPAGLFGGVGVDEDRVAWRLSPEPFWLSPATLAAIEGLGPDLLRFYRTLASLYQRSARGTAPAFIAEDLDRGKPGSVIKLGRQNRLKSDIPRVLRPDLILTDDGFTAAELDSVPGGMGFVGAMARAYCELGYDTVGGTFGMPDSLAAMLSALAGTERPVTAFVVSDESKAYRPEIGWMAETIAERGTGTAFACTPQDIVFTEDALFARLPDGREEKLDVLYRNFELFDLLNVPKQELMLYAARHNRVKHDAAAEGAVRGEIVVRAAAPSAARERCGGANSPTMCSTRLARASFLQTWILDPRPVPPQAFMHGPHRRRRACRARLDATGSARQGRARLRRQAVGVLRTRLGFARRARLRTTSRAKTSGRRSSRTASRSSSTRRTSSSASTRGSASRFPITSARRTSIAVLDGRVRLCPYYFVIGDDVRLGGILATIAPADKRLIHGMSDAILAPCAVREGGY
jgi:hypothetical protein